MRALAAILAMLTYFSPVLMATTPKPQTPGTLVVTYHTGRNAERLDRIRFRLISDDKEYAMFPQPGCFAEDHIEHLRRVVISGLEPGRYVVEFIVPNYDGLFGDLPRRDITIGPGELVKLDQSIKPRYCRIQATAILEAGSNIEISPTIILHTKRGEVKAQSSTGELVCNDLSPGEYTLAFKSLPGYATPEPVHFRVSSGTTVGPFHRVYYKQGIGSR